MKACDNCGRVLDQYEHRITVTFERAAREPGGVIVGIKEGKVGSLYCRACSSDIEDAVAAALRPFDLWLSMDAA